MLKHHLQIQPVRQGGSYRNKKAKQSMTGPVESNVETLHASLRWSPASDFFYLNHKPYFRTAISKHRVILLHL